MRHCIVLFSFFLSVSLHATSLSLPHSLTYSLPLSHSLTHSLTLSHTAGGDREHSKVPIGTVAGEKGMIALTKPASNGNGNGISSDSYDNKGANAKENGKENGNGSGSGGMLGNLMFYQY